MIERRYRETAAELREEGRIDTAASYYTSSAFGYLMEFRDVENPGTISPTKLGYFHRYLFVGALCYRISGSDARAERLCRQGVLVVEDVLEFEPQFREPTVEAPIGFLHEAIGDLRLVGQLNAYDDVYSEAETHYQLVDNPRQWSAEPEFEILIDTMVRLADGTVFSLDEDRIGRIRDLSLVDRIQYKRQEFPNVIQHVIHAGNWDDDRI